MFDINSAEGVTISNALDDYYTPAPGQTFQIEAAATALGQLLRYAYSDISEVPTPYPGQYHPKVHDRLEHLRSYAILDRALGIKPTSLAPHLKRRTYPQTRQGKNYGHYCD